MVIKSAGRNVPTYCSLRAP